MRERQAQANDTAAQDEETAWPPELQHQGTFEGKITRELRVRDETASNPESHKRFGHSPSQESE
jgi:hypothetical protein